MRLSLCVRAAATAAIALAGYMASSTLTFGVAGVSSAEAAGFYTRKRINGVWVEGRFPKAGRSVQASRRQRVARIRQAGRVSSVPASATLAALSAPELRREVGPVPPLPPIARATPIEAAPPPAAALPDIEAALVTAAVGPIAPVDEATVAAEERSLKLRRALQARADELKAEAERGTVTTAALPAPAPSPVVAVEAVSGPVSTSSIGAAMSSAAAVSSPSASAAKPLVPRSVSYDFETGIKTTVFENSVVREPFDVATMRSLTARSLATR